MDPKNKDLDPFISGFKILAIQLGSDPNQEPKDKVDNVDYEDESVDADSEPDGLLINFNGAVRISVFQNERALIPEVVPPKLDLENALIAVARIGLRPGAVEGRYTTQILQLVLANCYARVRAVFDVDVPEGTLKPSGYADLGGAHVNKLQMRREILERLGCNNIIVGFHIGWILTAVELMLPASRVVDLGTEESFQRFCRDLADARQEFKNVLIEHLAVSYDRRWPALLMREHIELYRIGEDDLYSEVVYTAGLWKVLGPRILERHRNVMVHKIKMIVQVGTGVGLDGDEFAIVERHVSLVEKADML